MRTNCIHSPSAICIKLNTIVANIEKSIKTLNTIMVRTTVQSIPVGAVQCTGPLLLDLNRFVTPDGKLYVVHPTSAKITQLKISKQGHYSWPNAKRLVDENEIDMDPIKGVYSKINGVRANALVAYYFVSKLDDPTGMRAQIIDKAQPLSSTNVEWITESEQRHLVASKQRTKVNPDNVYRVVTNIDLKQFTEWNEYLIKNDGTQVIKYVNNHYRDINIRTNPDGYRSVVLHIDGEQKSYRMNRLMAMIHHGDVDGKVVDHIDGNILNNTFDNLAIVDHTENVRRGKLATRFIKVDPITFEILEQIRCIREYTDKQGEGWTHQAIAHRIGSSEIYNGFLWFATETEGSRYIVKDNKVSYISLEVAVYTVRKNIDEHIHDERIQESMIPIIDNIPQPTQELENILLTLDPRGVGDYDSLQVTNDKIKDHMPCSRLVSYFGKTDAFQILICMNTLLVFTRSNDNGKQTDRKCPFCVFERNDSKGRRFGHSDPWGGIPIYTYNTALKTKVNPEPLKFITKYLTVSDAIKDEHGNLPCSEDKTNTIMKPLRWSVFQSSNGCFAKTDIPKRAACRKQYVSFYPPNNNLMDETNPSWIMSRRLDCALMTYMRSYYQTEYVKKKEAEKKQDQEKKAKEAFE